VSLRPSSTIDLHLNPLNSGCGSVALETFFLSATWLLLSAGHLGIWIALYNRINATGLKRHTIKRTEKAIVLLCLLIPIVLLGIEFDRMGWECFVRAGMEQWTWLTKSYGVIAAIAGLLMTPIWFLDRPQFQIAKDRYQVLEFENLEQLERQASNYVEGHSFRNMVRLPGNQIVSLQRNKKQIRLNRLPEDWVGLKIAHISDIHLTGQLATPYYRLAIEWIADQSPDLIVVSGDIVDYQECLEQLTPVFEGLHARHGMYFVLGNHDRRLANPLQIAEKLEGLGWVDLGRTQATITQGRSSLRLIGNESPWFSRSQSHSSPSKQSSAEGAAESSKAEGNDNHRLTLGVSHSPDQLRWGIRNGCALLLCGHTHGGQIRLPVVGPVISPSWYGSRYASGVFSKSGTVMHVSRGLSGTHPFRWGCLPEVSILILEPFVG
jgi:uncharacterized protein